MRKTKRKQPILIKREPIVLYDLDVVAPDELTIGEFCTDVELRRWWDRMRVYVKTAHSLDRAVMVKYIADEQKFYLSSVAEELPTPPTGAP